MPSLLPPEPPPPRRRSGWGLAVRIVSFVIAYLSLAGLCKLAFPPSVEFVSFWLPSGLFVAALLRSDTREWPAYLLAGAAANIAFDLNDGIAPSHVLLYAFGNCLESLTGAWLVRRFVAKRPGLSNVREITGVVVLSAVLSTMISATIGSTNVTLSEGSVAFGPIWLFWWGGNMLGVLLLAPILLCWPRTSLWKSMREAPLKSAEVALLFAVTCSASVFAFSSAPRAILPLTYLVIPCVLWAACRFGMLATACTNLLVAAFSAWYTARGLGVSATADLSPHLQFASHQLSLSIVALTGLFLAAALSQQRRTEETLRESEEKYSRVFHESPALISISDAETGAYLEVNDEALRVSGHRREEVIGRTAVEVGWITPEDRAHLLGQIAKHGGVSGLEMTFTAKDGRSLHGLVYTGLLNLGGRPRLLSTAIDITKLKTSEQELKGSQAALAESEQRYRLLVESSPESVIVILDGIVRFANPAAVRLFKAGSERDLAGKPMLDLVHPDSRKKALELRKGIFATGNNGPMTEMKYVRIDGTAFEGESQGSLVLFNGAPGLQISLHEITARKAIEHERQQFERKLQETQKLESLGVLAGGIAHDFNNILTGILGNASLASLDLPEGSPARESIDVIVEGSKRAADLCRQMLAYSGRGRLMVQKLSLTHLVEETSHFLKITVSKKAEMQFSLDESVPPIEADRTQVQQVVMNLVINASEAIGENPGVIRLHTSLVTVDRSYLESNRNRLVVEAPEGAYACLEVSDSGCGMSVETRSRIFDPFFTTKFTGRGLGLAAVLGIVRSHKGALLLHSAPDQGTTFKVLFPCSDQTPHAPPSPTPNPVAWKGHGRVLVVDDEEIVRKATAKFLSRMGFEVELAGDGLEALAVFRTDPGRFDLVIMDLTMPNIDGRQALAELRAVRGDVRVVLMSGFNQEEAHAPGAERHAAGFIQKPFEYASLAQVIRTALAS